MPPYVQAALICDKVLIEGDGTFSIIRAIDRVFAGAEFTEKDPLLFTCHLMICVRPSVSEAPAPVQVRIEIISPSGKRQMIGGKTVAMASFGGANLNNVLVVQFGTPGVYRFVISLNGQEASRVSLDVVAGAPAVGAPAPADAG